MKIVFGENLKAFRRKLNLSQSELAKMLTEAGKADGISIAYKNISKWENGNVCPDAPLLIHIAKVLDTTVDFLLTGKDPTRELFLENERLKGIQRVEIDEGSYIVRSDKLYLYFNDSTEYKNIEIVFHQGISKDITNDIFFNEVTIEIPAGVENFSLKCKLVDKPNRGAMSMTTAAYSLIR